ncbi:MAG: DUF309 domain-containing protein [Candidatus Omnitrophota bacterium]|nr:DUF309 domain-containing protein [Candidatus Omnitrophota bacterium]MDZ4242052.1 DUF309 domain-containing protein [Candidatus Omnitrophota bacterium]
MPPGKPALPSAPSENFSRYSQKSFPSYRYIQGLALHPTEHPQGHSFGRREPPPSVLAPKSWDQNEAYLFGVDLYNYAYWWESHEAWEGLWRLQPLDHPTSQFLQGLIKVSAAFLKWFLHQRRGMELTYQGAVAHLQAVRTRTRYYMGVDLDDHLKRLEKHFAPALKGEDAPWPDPLDGYPFIVLGD